MIGCHTFSRYGRSGYFQQWSQVIFAGVSFWRAEEMQKCRQFNEDRESVPTLPVICSINLPASLRQLAASGQRFITVTQFATIPKPGRVDLSALKTQRSSKRKYPGAL